MGLGKMQDAGCDIVAHRPYQLRGWGIRNSSLLIKDQILFILILFEGDLIFGFLSDCDHI